LWNCYKFVKQVQSKAKTDNLKFVDDEDRFTSFLFNMLANSFDIRANSELLISYQASADWINYTKAIAQILEDLIYFTSDAGAYLDINNDDDSSPYFEDNDGILYRKD